jgi:hypothetical protein
MSDQLGLLPRGSRSGVTPPSSVRLRPGEARTSPFAVPSWRAAVIIRPIWELVSRVEKGVSANRHATVKI